MIPHRAPPAQNGSGGSGGSAPRGAPSAGGAAGALDTLAQPCQSELARHRQRLRNRAKAKHATVALVIPLADLRSPLERSYRNTYYCAGLLEQHVNGRITAKYCNNRWCLVCLRVRTGRAINRYEPILLPWEGRQFVTLTVPNVRSDVLQTTIKELVRSSMTIARGIRRSDNLPFKALRKVECTYNPRTDTFHPHLHLIVDGFAPSERLVKRWLKAYPDASPRAQDIRACDPSQLRELFKYFTKLACSRGTGDKGWLDGSISQWDSLERSRRPTKRQTLALTM
jgi:hypothetical protein